MKRKTLEGGPNSILRTVQEIYDSMSATCTVQKAVYRKSTWLYILDNDNQIMYGRVMNLKFGLTSIHCISTTMYVGFMDVSCSK